jgi:UDP-N-acetylmuramate--alanine ligase
MQFFIKLKILHHWSHIHNYGMICNSYFLYGITKWIIITLLISNIGILLIQNIKYSYISYKILIFFFMNMKLWIESEKMTKYYLSGIAGSGMNVIGQYLIAAGNKVYGSDRNFDHGFDLEYKYYLESQGIVIVPQNGKIIDSSFDYCIFSAAVEQSVPDYQKAATLGIPILPRSHFLKNIFNEKKSIGIAGTSGKTTVTGMLTTILKECGLDFTLFCGSEIINYAKNGLGGNFFYSENDLLVAEVDESDKCIEKYKADIAVVLNISEDHMPLEDLKIIFFKYMKNAQHVIYNKDCPVLKKLIVKVGALAFVKTFSLKDDAADIFIDNIKIFPQGSFFTVKGIPFSLKVPGRYNIENAAAAISTAYMKGIPLSTIAKKLRAFKGMKGRYEKISVRNDQQIIYDFAHNPAKIESLLQTATLLNPAIIFFYQPHGYTAFKNHLNSLIKIFRRRIRKRDIVIIGKIYDAGGTVERTISSFLLVKEIKKSSRQAFYAENKEQTEALIKKYVKTVPVCFIVGARDRSLRDFAFKLKKNI